ncbi:MAG: DEAD/DEAH box helicase family protein [Selenomonadaceae bacterium]|nr:DEAD/DEAH box helicase family protein [Selenomonadaceae bacterium]
MQLKEYQQITLDILENFLSAARDIDIAAAFEQFRQAEDYPKNYRPLPQLEDVPYVCLRLPTGGGKTLIGTHAIQIAAENFLTCENPFVLWLVPTKEIRQQTLKVLRDPKSFYGEILRGAFNGRVNIFDVADFRNLRGDDLTGLNICVATFQSFKVTDREGRKVYQANEEMTPLFRNIPRQEYFQLDEHGRYQSFANLISYLRPLMIVDEAHNYSTALSFDVTEQLRPAAVIELTATPATNSNVLVKVPADELHEADMIKLPLILGEVSNSPEKTLDYAVQKRAALEKLSLAENDYIRPIALYQAENKNRDYNVDYIENYLREVAKIPAEQIAVATGERHELDGVNLFSRDCPIRHIITVQALKEGWDCPFASVFCSLSNTHSPKDAEQLLGRVLRMPYACRRKIPELNKAHAFVRVESWEQAVAQIKDDLRGMGFEKPEIERAILHQPQLFRETITLETSEPPKVDGLDLSLQQKISVEKTSSGYSVTFAQIDYDDMNELEVKRAKIFPKAEDREKLLNELRPKSSASKKLSPAERGVKFSIPQLCLKFGDTIEPFADTDFFPPNWSLVGTGDYDLPLSHEDPDIKRTEINLRGEKLTSRFLDASQDLFSGKTNWTQPELVGWLADKINFQAVTRDDFADFTQCALNYLINAKNFSLDELVRLRFLICRKLKEKINAHISAAKKRGWQTTLFGNSICVDKNIALTFDNKDYPATKFYTGSVEFNKHFYREVGEMNPEEISCAQCIDANPHVETWIRNVECDSEKSFWLQTHTDRFYPDFVVKLTDGTFAAVEYKGEVYKTNDDSREKNLVGELWANKSDGLCKFIMAVKRDDHGRDLYTQLNEFFGG